MRISIKNGKNHAERFLDAEEASKRPFPVELLDTLSVALAGLGDGALTCVITFRRTVPQKKAEMKWDRRRLEQTILFDTSLHASFEFRQVVPP